MKYQPIAFEINLSCEGFVFEVGSLCKALCGLEDQRDARGMRYALVTVLVYVAMAKLAKQDHLRGIAQWVRLRADKPADMLSLEKCRHRTRPRVLASWDRHFERVIDGKVTHHVVYGVTSLTAEEADPECLLALTRRHWQIENGLHYRRDVTLREDCRTPRTGHAAHAMALINNLVLGLLLRRGVRNVPDARRRFNAYPKQALALILGALA